MPPAIIIADSDEEEDETYSPRKGPQAVRSPHGEGPTTARSSDHVSHATSSTDPAFFQTVYDEQIDAARGHVPEAIHDRPGGGSPSSSVITPPAPFQRMVTGIIDTSSLTSITDPVAAKEQKSSGNKAMSDWAEISTPGRGKAPVAKMADPWDVPSSPDEPQARKAIIRLKRKRNKLLPQPPGETKKQSEHSRTDSHVLAEWNPNGRGADAHRETSPDRRKRRKFDYSQDSQMGSNDVDLVPLPLTNEDPVMEHQGEPEPGSSMFPPTLPAPSDRSFFVAARPLTDSQKLEYESVELDPSDHHSQETLPPIYNLNAQVIGSSGSATNVNTPRSDIPQSYCPPPDPTPSLRTRPNPSPRFRRNSSPDVIGAIETPAKENEVESTTDPKHAVPRNDVEEVLGKPDVMEPLAPAPIANDDKLDYVEPPTKSKKPRGRPKKKTGGEAALATQQQTSQVKDGEPGLRAKKKRGRPRKSEKPALVDKSPHSEAVTTDIDAQVENHGTKVEDESGTSPVGETASSRSLELNHKDDSEGPSAERKVDARTPAPETDDGEAKTPKKTSPDAVMPQTRSEQKVATGAKMRATVGNSKPLFRVGLSKRSRIAPLLKSLRK